MNFTDCLSSSPFPSFFSYSLLPFPSHTLSPFPHPQPPFSLPLPLPPSRLDRILVDFDSGRFVPGLIQFETKFYGTEFTTCLKESKNMGFRGIHIWVCSTALCFCLCSSQKQMHHYFRKTHRKDLPFDRFS